MELDKLKKFEIVFVDRGAIESGAYGYCNWTTKTIYVRDDLPWPVIFFVLVHECYHMLDHEGGVLKREAKATFLPVVLIPLGMIMVAVQTVFSKTRRQFIKRRIKEKR